MSRRALLSYASLLVVLLAAPLGSAQGPMASLAFKNVPTATVKATGETVIVPLDLTLTFQNVVCSSDTTAPVAVSVIAEATTNLTGNASVTGRATPPSLPFPVAAGPYGNNPALPAGKPYSRTLTVTTSIDAPGLTNATNVTVEVHATLGTISGCQGSAAIPAATAAPATFTIAYNATALVKPTMGPKLPVPTMVPMTALLVAVWFTRRVRA